MPLNRSTRVAERCSRLGSAALVVATSVAACACPPAPAVTARPEVATQPPPPVEDSAATKEIVSSTEAFANRICECSTASCADAVNGDFVEWLRAHPDRSGSPAAAKRVLVAMEKMLLCRDQLGYPGEPLDMEGGGTAEPGPAPGG